MRNKGSERFLICFMGLFLLFPFSAQAGSLDSPAAPTDAGSAMYTLEDIYNRLNDGTTAIKRAGVFTEPAVGPASTGRTLDEMMSLVNTRTPVEKTGQTICYDQDGNVIACGGTGQDGDLQKGVTWPNPRFSDIGNETVTDNMTGLTWLKDANCFGQRTWTNALSDANGLANGSCSLTDSSSAGDWHLPNVKELQSLIDFTFNNPALSDAAGTTQWTSGDAFTAVQSNYYWSSTTKSDNTSNAWVVTLTSGFVSNAGKTNARYVWPVRGGQ